MSDGSTLILLYDGSFEGLMARGGFRVSAEWKNGSVIRCRVEGKEGKAFRLRCNGKTVTAEGSIELTEI